jgi:hypothetical protein
MQWEQSRGIKLRGPTMWYPRLVSRKSTKLSPLLTESLYPWPPLCPPADKRAVGPIKMQWERRRRAKEATDKITGGLNPTS